MIGSTMYHYILNTNSRIHVGSSTWIGLFARSHQLLRVLERFCLTWWESRGHNHDNHVWIHLQDWDSPSWLSAQMEMAKVSQTFAFWQMLYMHLDISPVCFVQKVALDLTHTHTRSFGVPNSEYACQILIYHLSKIDQSYSTFGAIPVASMIAIFSFWSLWLFWFIIPWYPCVSNVCLVNLDESVIAGRSLARRSSTWCQICAVERVREKSYGSCRPFPKKMVVLLKSSLNF